MSLCIALRMTASVGASLCPTWRWEMRQVVRNDCCLAIQALQKHREQARSYKYLQFGSRL